MEKLTRRNDTGGYNSGQIHNCLRKKGTEKSNTEKSTEKRHTRNDPEEFTGKRRREKRCRNSQRKGLANGTTITANKNCTWGNVWDKWYGTIFVALNGTCIKALRSSISSVFPLCNTILVSQRAHLQPRIPEQRCLVRLHIFLLYITGKNH